MDINNREFYNVMYDEDLHDYINLNMKHKNKEIKEYNFTKDIIINYFLYLKKTELTNKNYDIYSTLYDENYKELKREETKSQTKIIPYIKTQQYLDDCKEYEEEQDWNEDKRLHYNAFFGRYKDRLHIIEYYEKMREDEENKVYEFEEDNNYEILSDYYSDIDEYDDIYNEDEEEDDDEYEY